MSRTCCKNRSRNAALREDGFFDMAAVRPHEVTTLRDLWSTEFELDQRPNRNTACGDFWPPLISLLGHVTLTGVVNSEVGVGRLIPWSARRSACSVSTTSSGSIARCA